MKESITLLEQVAGVVLALVLIGAHAWFWFGRGARFDRSPVFQRQRKLLTLFGDDRRDDNSASRSG